MIWNWMIRYCLYNIHIEPYNTIQYCSTWSYDQVGNDKQNEPYINQQSKKQLVCLQDFIVILGRLTIVLKFETSTGDLIHNNKQTLATYAWQNDLLMNTYLYFKRWKTMSIKQDLKYICKYIIFNIIYHIKQELSTLSKKYSHEYKHFISWFCNLTNTY